MDALECCCVMSGVGSLAAQLSYAARLAGTRWPGHVVAGVALLAGTYSCV